MSDSYSTNSTYQEESSLQASETIKSVVQERVSGNKERFKSPLPFTVVDLGCADGKNSTLILEMVIGIVRGYYPEFPIVIYLNDTPSTDLSIAVKKVTAQLSRFSNIWIHSTYKSFYESLFPEQSVDIMLSSIAIHWLPKVPSEIDALYCVLTKDLTSTEEGKIWEKSAAESLNGFLIERDKELRPEGLLIIIVPSMMDPPNKNDLVSIDCISAWKSCLQKSLSKYTLTYEKEYYLPLVIRSIKHFNSVFETDPKIKLKLVRSAYKLNELFPLGEDLQKNSIVYGNWLKGYSEEVLKTAMKQKGIDENLIEKVLSDFYNKEVPEHAIQDGLLMNPILVTTLLLFIQK